MRVSTLQSFTRGVDSILDQQSKLLDVQMRVSTGRKILNPADDPTGTAQLMGLKESIAINNQYQSNIVQAKTRMSIEEQTLGNTINTLQRVRELTVQGLNDTYGQEDRAALAAEVRQLMDEVLSLANSKDPNGEYLFAGFQSKAQPFDHDGSGTFSYLGDQGQRKIQIGATRQIDVSNSGMDVFMKIDNAAGTAKQDVFTTMYTLATDLEANSPNGDSLTELDNAIQNILDYQTKTGGHLNAVENQELINDGFLLELEKTRSTLEDLDLAEAATQLNQQATTLEAAQQAFIRVQGLSLFNFL